MCTTINYLKKYFGRNMDIDTSFNESLVFSPRNFKRQYKHFKSEPKYAMFGIASVVNKVPLFAEAMNEKGLYMAGLNFPINAKYNEAKNDYINLAPYELIPYFLSQFEDVEQIKKASDNFQKINITNVPFLENLPLAPMHFFLSDGKQNVVIEPYLDGLKIYDDRLGVLTNNPIYPDQVLNLQKYLNLQTKNPDKEFFDGAKINYIGQGFGLIGMPGDFSPASRFVRSVFFKKEMEKYESKNPINDVFHLLDNVKMIRGSVLTADNKLDITRYSICYDQENLMCYVKVYDSYKVLEISLNDFDLDGENIISTDIYA